MVKILRCKNCKRLLNVKGAKIIHADWGMIVIKVVCKICKTKNYIECGGWKIK